MTPEDLTSIGIQNPDHRKRLRIEISRLSIPDGVPDKPAKTLEEWYVQTNFILSQRKLFGGGQTFLWLSFSRFSQLRLVEHLASLKKQGFLTVDQVRQAQNKSNFQLNCFSGDVDQHWGSGGSGDLQAWPPEAADAWDQKSKTEQAENDQFWRTRWAEH